METLRVDLPAMYGDHHVVEVRKILLDLPGVDDLNASSAFRIVEVHYDKKKTSEEEIVAKLEEAGYMGDLPIPQETGEAASNGDKKDFRHTTSFKQVKQISFAHTTANSGRPLWPCPGMGTLPTVED